MCKDPPLFWFYPGRTPILPKHRVAEYKGANARDAPYNLKPVGTRSGVDLDLTLTDAA